MIEKATKEQIEAERIVFASAWEFLVKYRNIRQSNTPEEWEQFVKEAFSLAELKTPCNVNENYLAKSISILLADYIGLLSQQQK